jgi:hypothetical protein
MKLRNYKMWRRGRLQWHHLPTKFHENPPIGSEVISGGRTDTQAGDLLSLHSFLESRLIIAWTFLFLQRKLRLVLKVVNTLAYNRRLV